MDRPADCLGITGSLLQPRQPASQNAATRDYDRHPTQEILIALQRAVVQDQFRTSAPIRLQIVNMDPQLVRFRRQYFQLFEPDFLTWPPKSLLRDAGVQQWLYKQCFDTDANQYLPSDRYRLRVLKPLLRKVEQAIEDPEEDVGSNPYSFFQFLSPSCNIFRTICNPRC